MTEHKDTLKDSRLFSWRFFLDLTPEKKVLHILEGDSRSVLSISQYANHVVLLNSRSHNLINLDKDRQFLRRDNLNFVCSNYDHVPLKIGAFDIVIFELSESGDLFSDLYQRKATLSQAFSTLKKGGQFLLIIPNPFPLYELMRKRKIPRKYSKKGVLRYKSFFNAYQNLLLGHECKEVKIAYFYRGPLGEVFCLYGDNYHALNYYYKNFTTMNTFEGIKRLTYYIVARTKTYKLLADNYLFIAFK